MNRILEGIRVIDFTIGHHGPMATAMLGDLGAEVIKVEPPEGEAMRVLYQISGISSRLPGGRNFVFENCNRNKKSLAVDLKSEKGKEIMYRLVDKSDIFATNYLSKAVAQLGLDYETLRRRNPKIIYAGANAWGPLGPDADKPGWDYAGMARSGFMYGFGAPDGPPQKATGGIADQISAIILAYGLLVAIVARERLGIGQKVNTSMLGSMMALQELNVAGRLMVGSELLRLDRKKMPTPLYNHYECADGKWLVLAMLQSERYWPYLVKAMGLPELEKDPRFDSAEKREENCVELVSIFDSVFASKNRDEWIKIFNESEEELIYTELNPMSEVVNDEQVLTNGYVMDFDHPVLGQIRVPGFPVALSETPLRRELPAPDFAEHTEQILTETLDYTWEEVSELKIQKVIP